MIHTEGLSRRFGSVVAVDGVSLDVRDGEIFGFLGPNGAGKTTTIRMLSGLIGRSSGSAEVAGLDVGREEDRLKLWARIGFLPENVGLYEGESAYRNLEYYAKLHGVDPATRRRAIETLLRKMELWEKRDLAVGAYSKGMKQKVALARALVHDPVLVFLDEPTANLDPEASKRVREMILDLKKAGTTVFLNTHHLDEAQRICDRVGVLRTRLLTVGSPGELRGRLAGHRTVLRLERVDPRIVEAVRAAAPSGRVEVEADRLLVTVTDPEVDNPALAAAAVAAGGRLREMTQVTASLEDVYLDLIREPGGTP